MTAFCEVVSIICRRLMYLIRITFVIACEDQDFVVRRRFCTFTYDMTLGFFRVRVKVKDCGVGRVVFTFSRPIFPAFVPTFCRCLIRSVLYYGVGMAFCINDINEIFTIEFYFIMVYFARFCAKWIIHMDP